MSQKFKPNRLASAVSLAVVAGVGGVAGANANEFAASTLTLSPSTLGTVPKASSNLLSGVTVTLGSNDSVLGIPAGNLILTLDNGAKFVSGSAVTLTSLNGNLLFNSTVSNVAGDFVQADSGRSGALTVTASGGTASIVLPVQASSAGSIGLTVGALTLNTSSSTIDTPIKLSVDASSTWGTSFLTTGTGTSITTPKAAGATATTSGTVNSVAANATLALPSVVVTENIQKSLAASSGPKIRLTLPSGINFATSSNIAGQTYFSASDSSTVDQGLWVGGTATGSSNVLVLSVLADTTGAKATSASGAAKFSLSGLKAFVPNGQALGDVNVTVEATLDNGSDNYTSLGTLKVGTVATASAGVAAYSASGSLSTQYEKLFTGRVYTSGITTGYTTGVKVTENMFGTLAAAGTVTFKATGVTAQSGQQLFSFTNANGTSDLAGSGTTTASDTSVYTVSSASTSTGKEATLVGALNKFKVTGAAGTKVSVAVSSTTNVTGASADVAEIIDATSASVSGSIPVGAASGTVTLPDIVISENTYGAIVGASDGIAIAADAAQVSAFDITSMTVKAYKLADGSDVSSSVLTAGAAVKDNGAAGSDLADVIIPLTGAASTSTTGAVKIVVSGLKATLGANASGDVNVTVGGSSKTAGVGDIDTAADIDPNAGAKITSATLKVAGLSKANSNYVSPIVTGAVTSQTIAADFAPSTNDAGKQGSVFVAAVLPASLGGGAFFMNSSSNWVAFTECKTAPAYSTGTLATTSNIPVVKAAVDLSSLIGTTIYIGSGVGGALSPAGTACNNMLNNGTYAPAYTIK